MATQKLTAVVIDALEDIKARDIMLINVSKLTSVFDYIAVASADSTRQTKALAKHVMDKVKLYGGWIYGTEGELSGEWVLVDCGDVVVHIMQPAVREHYKLEELWGEGKLEFPKPVAPKRKPAADKVTEKIKAVAKTKSKKTPTPKPRVPKPKSAKSGAAGARVTVGKKKTVAATGVAKKVATTTRQKTPATVVKKPVAKKPAAIKPVTRRRKGTE